jgi:hypothetical protein
LLGIGSQFESIHTVDGKVCLTADRQQTRENIGGPPVAGNASSLTRAVLRLSPAIIEARIRIIACWTRYRGFRLPTYYPE